MKKKRKEEGGIVSEKGKYGGKGRARARTTRWYRKSNSATLTCGGWSCDLRKSEIGPFHVQRGRVPYTGMKRYSSFWSTHLT